MQTAELLTMLVGAFIGGFFLNFMPCVLPILSLKLLAYSKDNADHKTSYIVIFLGIVCSFVAFGITSIILRESGKRLGLDAGFQNPQFIIILMLLLTIFISASIDRIYFRIPRFLTSRLSPYIAKKQYLNDFVNGVLITILSTSCTAPFLGSAVAFSMISENNILIILTFICIAVGFGTPYLLLLFCPKIISFIPKPGKWTLTFKKIMASLLIATVIWLGSTLYIQLGLRPVVGLVLLLILLKFFLENKTGISANLLMKLPIIFIIFLGSLYLPSMAHEEDLEHQAKINSVWQEFDAIALARYVNDNKIVVVRVSAEWCATCKLNKLLVWEREKTAKLFNRKNIIAMHADYTNHSNRIQNYLISNNSYGIPFSKVYGPRAKQGLMLPSLIFYSDLIKAINAVASSKKN